MKLLETTFNKNSYTHEIIWRDSDYAITRLTDQDSGKFVCYEAFRIRKKKDTKIGNRFIPASEMTPSNEEWGLYGYTTRTEAQAKQKINLLKNKQHGTKL